MRYIEYQIYDVDDTETEIKTKVENAISIGVNVISVPYAYTKLCRTITKNTNVIVANPIDYPLGILDTSTRNSATLNAINNGAQKINIVIPNYYLANKKYDKIKNDISTNYKICLDHNVELSYYLEYRVFTHQSLIKACGLLLENNIKKIYVSTGYLMDNPEDNLIATVLLKDKSNIDAIFTGNIWTTKHTDNLKKNNINRISTNNLQSLKLINRYI